MSRLHNTKFPGVALIFGAASGIGAGVAHSFAAARCHKIFLGDINLGLLQTVASDIASKFPASKIETRMVNISEEKSVEEAVNACVQLFGRVDYACNVAGVICPRRPISEDTIEDYDRIINVNEFGTWLCHRAEIRAMSSQRALPGSRCVGSIVSVSSVAGIQPTRGVNIYGGTKHAIINIVKTDAQDFGEMGIRVNAVCPGTINTELFRQSYPQGAPEALLNVIPLRRLGDVDDIGSAILFLSSDDASFITGAVLPVDGGIVLERRQV